MPKFLFILIALMLVAGLTSVMAADQIHQQAVQFRPGTTGIGYEHSIHGYDSYEYTLRANVGQIMHVELQTSNPSNYFNVLPPGGGEAIFIGSTEGKEFTRKLRESGEYRVQVYLMRNAAGRDEEARYAINFEIHGAERAGAAPGGAAGASAPRALQSTPPAAPAYAASTDYADSDSGGPDYWRVTGLEPDDLLNLRMGPSTREPVVGGLANGDVVRNLRCEGYAPDRWCEVGVLDEMGGSGWVSARYLAESGAPRSGMAANRQGDDVPELVPRSNGEYEVRWRSGCTVLYAPDGYLETAGAGCNSDQAARSRDAVEAFRRDQGL